MRRAALAVAGTAASLAALLSYRTPAPATQPSTQASAQPSAQPSAQASAQAAAGAPAATRTLTGLVATTRWGPVQVAAVLTDGRLTAVRVLQSPTGNGQDREIAAYALPRLTAAALKAQSADVDTVSGATYTSQGYRQSLQSALDQR